jgi:hypothetical protein
MGFAYDMHYQRFVTMLLHMTKWLDDLPMHISNMFKLTYKLNLSLALISSTKAQGSLTWEKIAWILDWAKKLKHANEYRECDVFMFL